MRIVVAQKPGRGAGPSRATRYISERGRDPAREGPGPRPLFSDREDSLTYVQADRLLGGSGGAPAKDDLIHFSVSFQVEDYKALGATEEERKQRVRELTRESLQELAGELSLEKLKWVAGIHLNTAHPHVHVLIAKDAEGKDGPERVESLPKSVLSKREADGAGGPGRVIPGRLSDIFEDALERQLDRARGRGDKARDQERRDLGRALVAEYRLAALEQDYDLAERTGQYWRLRVYDTHTSHRRQISKRDVEQRAEAVARREMLERPRTRAQDRREVRELLVEGQIYRQRQTMAELQTAQDQIVRRLAEKLEAARQDMGRTAPKAERIRAAYQARGEGLPVPIIEPQVLSELQEKALKHRDTERFSSLEAIRISLAREEGRPSRTDNEAARLAAQLFTAETDVAASQARRLRFEATHHQRRWHVGHERWSLVEVDRALAGANDRAKFFGRFQLHLDSKARGAAALEAVRFLKIRTEVTSLIRGERERVQSDETRSAQVMGLLRESYQRESHARAERGQTMPSPLFTAEEVRRIEANAEVTRSAALIRELPLLEAQVVESDRKKLPSESQRDGRALAREIIGELALREAAERLQSFQERKYQTPFAVVDLHGQEVTRTLAQVEGSKIDWLLRPFFEKDEQRSVRRAVQEAAAERQQVLQAGLRQAREYLDAVRDLAAAVRESYGAEGMGKEPPLPAFTAKERITLEIYAERQTDPAERAHYLHLAQSNVPEIGLRQERYSADVDRGHDHGRQHDQSRDVGIDDRYIELSR